MKKLAISSFLLALALGLNAQTKDTTTKSAINGNNELRLNLAYTIAGIPELNYERILKDDMSVGLAVMVGLEDDSDFKFGVIPNYRVYFGNKKANGFFIEGNAAIITSRLSYYDYSSLIYTDYAPGYSPTFNPIYKNETNFGLGAAAGAKFLTKNGFIGEIYVGAGRIFGASNIEAYPRAGITIGKRF